MKFARLFLLAVLALTVAPTIHAYPVPTCDPSAGCTMKNGCSGGPCKL